MAESLNRFNHKACAQEYIKLYEKMLDRPLVNRDVSDGVLKAPEFNA